MQQAISTQQFQVIGHKSYRANALVTTGFITKFLAWCNLQEKNWFLWLGIALMVSIGTVVPLTLFAIICGANNDFTLWVIVCVTNVPVLVVNLAGQPTKVKLPVLFFAWFVDAIIIAYCLFLFLMR
jgi:hypothetical protein